MVKKLAKRTRLLSGVAIGAVLMYLFDPERGDARRLRLREQLRTGRATREDELGYDVRPRTETPPPASTFEQSTITPRPLAG